jgi:hypothetical protein
MKQLSRFLIIALVATIGFYSCTEKEVELPTEDTQRTDRLRNELEALMTELYGLESDRLGAEISKLYAEIEEAQLNGAIENVQQYIEDEIEELTLSLNRTVAYTLTVVDLQSDPIEGATVQLAQGDELVSQTTDGNGQVQFNNLSGEYIAVNVNAENYSTASYRAYFETSSNDTTYESSTMPLINTTGGPTYELKLDLYADYSDLDDTLNNNSPSSKILKRINFPGSDYERLDPVTNATLHVRLSDEYLNLSGAGASFSLYDITYSDVFWDPEVEGNSYTFNLPVRSIWGQNLNYQIYFNEIKTTKKVLVDGSSSPSPGENPPAWDREMYYRLSPIGFSAANVEGQTLYLGSYKLSEFLN